jgi:hypothetical protein
MDTCLELWGKDKALAGTVLPQFSRVAGERLRYRRRLSPLQRALTAAVNSIGCTSSCYDCSDCDGGQTREGGDCTPGLTPEMAATSV